MGQKGQWAWRQEAGGDLLEAATLCHQGTALTFKAHIHKGDISFHGYLSGYHKDQMRSWTETPLGKPEEL